MRHRRRPWRRLLHVLSFMLLLLFQVNASTADIQVYAPALPPVLAYNESLHGLELRVYLPADMNGTSVWITPNCSLIQFTPRWLQFNSSASVVQTFALEAQDSGVCSIEYAATTLDPETMRQDDSNASIMATQSIDILPPPTSYDVYDSQWAGVVLQNDSFEELDEDSIVYAGIGDNASTLWGRVKHGFPSAACGAASGQRALYFTALGLRFAMTNPLNLLGFHGKMHFDQVYGFHAVQAYEGDGDNRISCESPETGEEIVFSFLPEGLNASNQSCWQTLYEVPLPALPSEAFQPYTVVLPSLAMHSTAQFRWQQKNHSSFPLDVANGTTRALLDQGENDDTEVYGLLGLMERELWQYRNLFDQWALDEIRLEVRLNPPTFTQVETSSLASTVIVESPVPNSWVQVLIGDGTQAFPECDFEMTAVEHEATVVLSESGYIHAIACMVTSHGSPVSSYAVRSPIYLVHASPPTLTSALDSSAGVDRWTIQLQCSDCDFMRYTIVSATGSVSVGDTPSCSYGLLANSSVYSVSVNANARLVVVACGLSRLVSQAVESGAFTVAPRAPSFDYLYPLTTVSSFMNVTISMTESTEPNVQLGIAYVIATEDNSLIPTCSSGASSTNELTISVKVFDVVRAVTCCLNVACTDSQMASWGPLSVQAVAPVVSMACSRVRPRTMTVTILPVTVNASIRAQIGSPFSDQACVLMDPSSESMDIAVESTTLYVISCLDGLDASDAVEVPVLLDDCCAGLDAYEYESCAHVLLLYDNFTACVDATKWTASTAQWGGDDVNGGVHASNVQCVNSSGEFILGLEAHGDVYSGTTPIGVHRIASNESLVNRTVDDAYLEWALDGAAPVPCNQLDRCAARRVGAAVRSSGLTVNAGVLVVRVKPCDLVGTLTQLWWGEYESYDAESLQEIAFLALWKASLAQAKTTPAVPFVMSSTMLPDVNASASSEFMELALQWNASQGRANLYVNGLLVHRQDDSDLATSDLSAVSVGVWFPNAVAGEPLFDSCRVLIDEVRVFDLQIAGDRWCEFDDQLQVSCSSDADCLAWVSANCFMPIYEAVCLDTSGCQFRLQPSIQSSSFSTDMTMRTSSLHWTPQE